ncbi:hypothetical protein M426DRAFT_15427 [Hypoxylon sp. CI-4A]|nr:hypothetical protein M426DRAFT_15427 [Hypoxylon sp. CI-4A]
MRRSTRSQHSSRTLPSVTNSSAMTQTQQEDSFKWSSCGDCDDQKRIAIKEEALKVGLTFCEELIEVFGRALNSNTLSRDIIEKWMHDCKKIIERHRNFEVLIGVAGPTGSGKTSALNALLGLVELLPTNNEEAATAVPCRVSYNDDERPEFKFRASVVFRTKADFAKQLDQFFEDLKSRDELLEANDGSKEDREAIQNAKVALKPTLEMIEKVFDLDEVDVAKMTTKDLLKSNQDIIKLLGTTKQYHSSDAEQFSEQIKPYLDSTTAQHTESGSEFAAWPLISEVKIFVKSDILLNGVVLVDLPGLGDSVESRAAVAEAYFPKLTATLIVAPARRAADDSTSVRLMSDHQELQMKMDGKFHKRSYCIVISQIDDIERKSALRSRDSKADEDLQQLLKEEKALKLKEQKMTRELNDARNERSKASRIAVARGKMTSDETSRTTKSDLWRQYKTLKQTVSKLARSRATLGKRLDDLAHNITFLCIKNRNLFLKKRIQRDFERRQASMDGGRRLEGFPEQKYSGIPNLKRWIRDATILEREHHADSLLHALHHQVNVIQTWSKNEWGHDRLEINREWIEKEISSSVSDNLKGKLDGYWPILDGLVQEHNPLNNRPNWLSDCADEYLDVAEGWSYKRKDNRSSQNRLHWQTYKANVQRNGESFVSRSGPERVEYHWMEDVSDILLRMVVADWNKAFHHDIPGQIYLARERIDIVWDAFIQRLQIGVEEYIPALKPFLDQVMPSLDVIKKKIMDSIRWALGDISRNAYKVHHDLVDSIQSNWLATFAKAKKIKGTGSSKRRENIIINFVKGKGHGMLNVVFDDMKMRLKTEFDKLPQTLDAISALAVEAAKDHIRALLDNIIVPGVKLEDAVEEKLRLQQQVRGALVRLHQDWKVPDSVHVTSMDTEDVGFPIKYCVKQNSEDEMNLDDDDFMDPKDEDGSSDDNDQV